MNYFLERIRELDTFSSIILFAAAMIGWTVNPELIESTHVLLVAILSGLGIITPDKEKK